MAETIKVFCSSEQAETEHELDFSPSGEIVLTCTGILRYNHLTNHDTKEEWDEPVHCGRFVKFPAGTDAETLKDLLAKHKAANEGQVTQASIDAKKAELLAGLKQKPEEGV